MNDVTKAPIIIGNWKMHMTISQAKKYLHHFAPLIQGSSLHVYLAAPFTILSEIAPLCKMSNIVLGAQNMNDQRPQAWPDGFSQRLHIFAVGTSFDVDAFLAQSPLRPDFVWRKMGNGPTKRIGTPPR